MPGDEDRKRRFYATLADGEYGPDHISALFDAWLTESGESEEPLDDSSIGPAIKHEAANRPSHSSKQSNDPNSIATFTSDFALIIEDGRFTALRMPDGQRREVKPMRDYLAEREENAPLN